MEKIRFIECLYVEEFISKMHKKFISIDLETTGLDSDFDSVIEIGAILFAGGAIVDSFNYLINQQCFLPPLITQLTGISNEMILKANSLDFVVDRLLNFIESSFEDEIYICVHNASFDIPFLNRLIPLHYDKIIYYIDTVKFARICSINCINYKLSTLSEYFGISQARYHRAYDDAMACGLLFNKLKKYYDEL